MKHLLYTLIILLGSCQQNKTSTTHLITTDSLAIDTLQTTFSIDTLEAKTWLQQLIMYYFKDSIDIQQITTAEYYDFKQDAMNVGLELDDSLTEEEFERKWKGKFDLKVHPIQTGFLISGQDWGNITVPSLYVTHMDKTNNSITIRTLIRDEEFQVEYDRDIIVVRQTDKYLIADVLEYD